MESAVAWLVLPALLLAVSFGLGALLRRVTGTELPDGLLAPVGAALALVLVLAGYIVGLRGLLTPALVVVLAIAGLLVGVRGRPLPRPGIGALVFSGIYGLYLAPVVLSGHWTWTGYNFVNDTSIQLLLAEWLPGHGRTPPPAMFVTTPLDALSSYLSGGYPLGSHALLAGMHELVPIRMEALYQPFISTFAGLGAMALVVLVRRAVGRGWAVFVAFTAIASNLLYQYALQGNMKEIVTAAMLATTAAVASWSLSALRDAEPARRGRIMIGAAVLFAVPASAGVSALSTAGAPYVALIALLWLVLLLVQRLTPGPSGIALALGAGSTVLLAGTVATLSTLITFGRTTSVTYAAPERASDLGHLARPLEARQTTGVWLIGDYRLAPEGLEATLTTLGVWLVLALALVAVVYAVRRRRPELLLFTVPTVAIMLLVTPRVSPYADAKTFMLMAPGITLLGALGAAALARLRQPLGWLAAGLMLLGVLGSDALAYHVVHLAPTDRMAALRDLDRQFAGEGLILFNEPEEFAKNFMRESRLNVGAEAVTPKQTQLRVPQAFAYLWYDLDDLTPEYVDQFPLIAVRRSPVASRPPVNFRLVYRNRYYEAWRRLPAPGVVDHLPLQGIHQVAARPKCADVQALAARARGDQVLMAARAPTLVALDTANADRSESWRPHPYRADMVLTGAPGEAHATVTVTRPGRYRAWIAGSFGRSIGAYVDGRRIGQAVGVNTVGQWHEVADVELARGRHELRITRGGGGLAPGDGFSGELGPFALRRIEPEDILRVRPARARAELCGRSWDWIELVSP